MEFSAAFKKLVPPGVYIVALGGCLFGFPWEGAVIMPAPTGELVLPILDVEVAHPYLFLLLIGYGLGLWGWPFLREWWTRKENHKDFYKQWASWEFGKTKSDLFKFLSRGYESWKQNWMGSALPDSFNEFIEQAQYPDWLKGDALNSNYQPNIDLNQPYWAFADALYREVNDYIAKRVQPKLLSGEEADEFHLARQRFAYFWGTTARRVENGELKFKALKECVKNDRRILKALCYMEVILHDVTYQKGSGKEQLFDLCRKYFLEEE